MTRNELKSLPIFAAMYEAIDGAYLAAPDGEGVNGALHMAAVAAVAVLVGMTPADAVAAIGPTGTYGVKRRYGLIPLATDGHIMGGTMLRLYFKSEEEAAAALRAAIKVEEF